MLKEGKGTDDILGEGGGNEVEKSSPLLKEKEIEQVLKGLTKGAKESCEAFPRF